jgi:neutral ceramidase
MKRLSLAVYLTGALSLAAPGLLLAQSSGAGRLRAGAAKVDITPKPSQLTIATDSIRDHLYVRAIVVDDGRSCAAIVNVDGGARDADAAIAKSAASTKCPAENYIISGTNDRSGHRLGGRYGEIEACAGARWVREGQPGSER